MSHIQERMKKLGVKQVDLILELRKRGITVQPPEMSSMKFLPKKKLALTMETFGERAFVGIIPTRIERMVERLLLSDTCPNVHCLTAGSKKII